MMSPQPMHIARNEAVRTSLLFSVAVLVALAAFGGNLLELVRRWTQQEEYSHGFLIPVIVVWLLWARRDALASSMGRPSWSGLLLIVLAAAMLFVGELSAFFLLSQIGFILTLLGIVLAIGGYPLLRITVVPILFLLFAIPLPYLVDSELSWRLQLISSQLGVFILRLFEVPVFLTGNIIDLGHYKLQVVDACSGLRYLYPLLSLGFLAAYFFHAPFWQRALVFLSAVPITIGMNSLRIAIVGILVDTWGIEMADGLLHLFEGWVIFLVCAAFLAAEMYGLARLSGKPFFEVFHVPTITVGPSRAATVGPSRAAPRLAATRIPAIACLLVLLGAGAAVHFVSNREEIVPERLRFVAFPAKLGPWQGRPSLLEPQVEHFLGLEDYILSDYTEPGGAAVNFYVAYYASQRKGSSPHSPIVCIPGGGWQIATLQRTKYTSNDLKLRLPLNRVVIEQNSKQLLVYYWFVQRGRNIANEYWSKWYLFADAITKNRTDGALVRVTTPIYQGEPQSRADERLQAFLQELEPRLSAYLPSETAAHVGSVLPRHKDNES